MRFGCRHPNGTKMTGLEAVRESMRLSIEASKAVSECLKWPNELSFEKTIYPTALFAKKRYIGGYYMTPEQNRPVIKYMGIILKRRDNAPIAKHFYAGVVDTFLRRILQPDIQKWMAENPEQDVKAILINEALNFLDTETKKLLSNKFKKDKFVVSKTLKSTYKNPESIAHKVLADRANNRGSNSFQSNDRIPYVHVVVPIKKGEKQLQGDRIETPEFATANKLKLDYKHYLERQIETPVAQVFALVLEQLDGFKTRQADYEKMMRLAAKSADEKKIQDTRTKIAADILFRDVYLEYERKLSGNKSVKDFFSPVSPKTTIPATTGHESSQPSHSPTAKLARAPPKNQAMDKFLGKQKGHISWKQL